MVACGPDPWPTIVTATHFEKAVGSPDLKVCPSSVSISMILEAVLVMSSAAFTTAQLPRLDARAFSSSAVCMSQFSWTDNSKNISPCDVAASVFGTCGGSTWNITPLNSSYRYSVPVAVNGTVNLCSCSWAAYNLISACTLCQGFEVSIQNWSYYKDDCGNKVSNEYFPSQLVLPSGTAIPFYAATDPTTWSDQRFNLGQAKAIHDQGTPDKVQTSSSGKSSTPVGAIVGGVIGGLAVVILGGLVALFMYRKKQKRQTPATVTHSHEDASGHSRTMSDLSQKSNGIGFGYQRMDRSLATTSPSSRPPMSPTSGTMHTHTSSVNSLSYFGSINPSVAPYSSPPPPAARTLSPSPPPNHGMNREDIIVPFTLTPSPEAISRQGSHSNLTDRKRSDGAIIPIYDSPNSLPQQLIQHSSSSSEHSVPRRRLNPPAYSAVDTASQAPTRRPQAHSKKGSADTQHSMESNLSGVTTVRHGSAGSGGGSIAAIDDIITQMDLGQGMDTVSGSGGTLATGQSRQFPTRNQVFRPVIENPDS